MSTLQLHTFAAPCADDLGNARFAQHLGQSGLGWRLSMHQRHPFDPAGPGGLTHEVEQISLVGMGGESTQGPDPCVYVALDTEDADGTAAFDEAPSQGVLRHESYDHHRILGLGQCAGKVVYNPPPLAHSRACDDDTTLFAGLEILGSGNVGDVAQAGRGEGVIALEDPLAHVGCEILGMELVDLGDGDRERTVDVDGNVGHASALVQTFECEEDLLRTLEGPIGVLSVAGMYRSGKSYLLNRVLLNRSRGFDVGHTINACTKVSVYLGSELLRRVPAEIDRVRQSTCCRP